MIDAPKTLKEAKKYRYDKSGMNPVGLAYEEGRCAAEISILRGWHCVQCSRSNGFGLEKLYCKQHAKKIVSRKG